jgi:hypothetical protein
MPSSVRRAGWSRQNEIEANVSLRDRPYCDASAASEPRLERDPRSHGDSDLDYPRRLDQSPKQCALFTIRCGCFDLSRWQPWVERSPTTQPAYARTNFAMRWHRVTPMCPVRVVSTVLDVANDEVVTLACGKRASISMFLNARRLRLVNANFADSAAASYFDPRAHRWDAYGETRTA